MLVIDYVQPKGCAGGVLGVGGVTGGGGGVIGSGNVVGRCG
jgi:hypothetical protein